MHWERGSSSRSSRLVLPSCCESRGGLSNFESDLRGAAQLIDSATSFNPGVPMRGTSSGYACGERRLASPDPAELLPETVSGRAQPARRLLEQPDERRSEPLRDAGATGPDPQLRRDS